MTASLDVAALACIASHAAAEDASRRGPGERPRMVGADRGAIERDPNAHASSDVEYVRLELVRVQRLLDEARRDLALYRDALDERNQRDRERCARPACEPYMARGMACPECPIDGGVVVETAEELAAAWRERG